MLELKLREIKELEKVLNNVSIDYYLNNLTDIYYHQQIIASFGINGTTGKVFKLVNKRSHIHCDTFIFVYGMNCYRIS